MKSKTTRPKETVFGLYQKEGNKGRRRGGDSQPTQGGFGLYAFALYDHYSTVYFLTASPRPPYVTYKYYCLTILYKCGSLINILHFTYQYSPYVTLEDRNDVV